MNDAIARIEAAVRRSVDAGAPNSIAVWNRTGRSERFGRRRRWWMDHHDDAFDGECTVVVFSAVDESPPAMSRIRTLLRPRVNAASTPP